MSNRKGRAKPADIVRSSAAEYLTYISALGGEPQSVDIRYEEQNIWLTQKLMATLYGVDVRTISEHLRNIFATSELEQEAVVRKFRITAADGKSYDTQHYALQAIIAVGFKVGGERAVQFRKWANQIVKEYTIKGFAMDDERLKQGGTILTEDFFEEQLQRVREIRLSERRFYQKVTDIYATAIDYDASAEATKRFFAAVQNKAHWAIHGQTAAEVILTRADAERQHMGLTTWRDAPDGKIHKFDTVVAKNYLTDSEMQSLSRLVSSYLDFAELMAQRRIPMTMSDWEERLDRFLAVASDRELLRDAGRVSAEVARAHAETEFEKYRVVQDQQFVSDFDKFLELPVAQDQEDRP